MKLRLGLLFAIAIAMLLLAPAEAQDAAYVGSELCADCHEGYEEGLAMSPHGKQGFANLSTHGCESCHGPSEKHLEDPEAFQPRVIDLSKDEQSAMCQSCHAGESQFFWKGSMHDTRGLSCLDCHVDTLQRLDAPNEQQQRTSAVSDGTLSTGASPRREERSIDFIVANAADVVHMSVTEVSEQVGASEGSVVGLMPHPEHAVDPLAGGTDGRALFESVAACSAKQ